VTDKTLTMGMSGAELRAIRRRLELTLQQFAPRLGIRDELNISGPVEKLARLLAQWAEAEQKGAPKRKR
jgi:hypothetical protein